MSDSHNSDHDLSCVQCDDPAVFALQQGEHTLYLGLSTLLQCLQFAEQQFALPPLPSEWWNEVIKTRNNGCPYQ